MKKYAIIDWVKNGDHFEEIFETEKEALQKAEYEWSVMTERGRTGREMFAVMVGELDEDGCFDLDTADIIKSFK